MTVALDSALSDPGRPGKSPRARTRPGSRPWALKPRDVLNNVADVVRLLAPGSRSGIGRTATAVVIIVVVALGAGVGVTLNILNKGTTPPSSTTGSTTSASSSTLLTTSSTSSTTSTTSTSTECVYSQPPPVIVRNTTVLPIFTGCLTPGATGMYLIGVNDSNGVVALGVVKTSLPANISVIGYQVGSFPPAGKGAVAEAVTNTTVLPMPELRLLPRVGYAVVFVNTSGENNTVTINLTLTDFATFVAGG